MKSVVILFLFLPLLLIIVFSHFTFEAESLQTGASAAALGENTTRAVERTRGGASAGGGHGGTGGGTDNGGGSGSGYGSGMPNLGVTPADHSRNNGGNRNHKKSAAVGRSCSFTLIVVITFSSAAALIQCFVQCFN